MVGISLPDQTDATLSRGEKLIELAFPIADKTRRRVQVRNLARDVAQIGTEHIGCVDQRTVVIEWLVDWPSIRQQDGDPIAALQEGHQRSLCMDDRPCPLLLKDLCVANEMDRISESLLGVEQDRFALQVLAAPFGLRIAMLDRLGAVPSMAIFLPAFLEVALQ